ncbi:mechanosensitive ion channel domain-containing protein [Shigella flexneri]
MSPDKIFWSNFFSGLCSISTVLSYGTGSVHRQNVEGTVAEIGWRITKISTFDNRPLYVPNSLFSSIASRTRTNDQPAHYHDHWFTL